MEAHARAGIDIHGTVLRYAEVEQYGSRYRLLRLGSCDFDFDVAHEVLSAEAPGHLEVVADALRDVFEGSTATHLQVALHPPEGFSFFTPLPSATDEETVLRRLELEAELLVSAGGGEPLHLEIDSLRSESLEDGSSVDWFHVLALRPQAYARFEEVVGKLPQVAHHLSLSTHGAAAVLAQLERRPEGAAHPKSPFALGIGRYESHIEYTLCRDGHWLYSGHAPATEPADSAYFAVGLLHQLRLQPADIGRLAAYGSGAGAGGWDLLEHIFRLEVEELDPLRLVDLEPGSLAARFDAAAYVPCIGVAL